VPSGSQHWTVSPASGRLDAASFYSLLLSQLFVQKVSWSEFIVEHYFGTQSCEAVKQSYQALCPHATVTDKSAILLLVIWQSFREYVERG
jgi:hypothetical protein